MDTDLILRSIPFLGQAALMTLALAAGSLALGLPVAAGLAAARFARWWPVRALAVAYVSVMRGTPLLVQLFVLYFGGPQIGVTLSPFAAGVVAFGLNIGAYMSEGLRGAILSVDRGQGEAARTLGFGRLATMMHFILPQCVALMIRSLGVNTVILIKGTALISTIGVVDLTYSAQRIMTSSTRPFEVFGIAAAYYMLIVFGLTLIMRLIERRFALPTEARA
jgi:polar amino acid transport system permease protein